MKAWKGFRACGLALLLAAWWAGSLTASERVVRDENGVRVILRDSSSSNSGKCSRCGAALSGGTGGSCPGCGARITSSSAGTRNEQTRVVKITTDDPRRLEAIAQYDKDLDVRDEAAQKYQRVMPDVIAKIKSVEEVLAYAMAPEVRYSLGDRFEVNTDGKAVRKFAEAGVGGMAVRRLAGVCNQAELQDHLVKIAVGSKSPSARAAAAAKLTDLVLLSRLAKGDGDHDVKAAAVTSYCANAKAQGTDPRELLAAILLREKNPSVLRAAVRGTEDPALLLLLLRRADLDQAQTLLKKFGEGLDEAVGTAVAKVDPAALEDLAGRAPSKLVAQYAKERLECTKMGKEWKPPSVLRLEWPPTE